MPVAMWCRTVSKTMARPYGFFALSDTGATKAEPVRDAGSGTASERTMSSAASVRRPKPSTRVVYISRSVVCISR